MEEEEGIYGRGGAGKSKKSSLEKLLRGGDVYNRDSLLNRDVRKKSKILGAGKEKVLLTRKELLGEKDIYSSEEELFGIMGDENIKHERDIKKSHLKKPYLEEEDIENSLLKPKKKRGILNPLHKGYKEEEEGGILESVSSSLPVHKKLVGSGESKDLSYNIKIDEKEIDELIEDFEDFSDKYLHKTKKERKALMKKLNEAFRNTAAKMILNFGKIIPPVVQSWVEVMRHVQVNPECDQNKAVKCLNPMEGYETLYFNPRCLEKYNCHFEIEDIDPKNLRLKMDNVTRNYERVNRFFNSINVENMKKVRPSFDKYLEKASGLHEEFADLLKEHGAKILGCDESCIEDCLDTTFVTFWEIPMCVNNCACKYGLI